MVRLRVRVGLGLVTSKKFHLQYVRLTLPELKGRLEKLRKNLYGDP